MSSPGDALAQLQAQDKKIAELEADKEQLREGQKALLRKLRKAEAEVERLRTENMKTLRSRQFPMWMQAFWAEEDEQSGGRESGKQGVLRAPETVSSHREPARADAAAEPAAPLLCDKIIEGESAPWDCRLPAGHRGPHMRHVPAAPTRVASPPLCAKCGTLIKPGPLGTWVHTSPVQVGDHAAAEPAALCTCAIIIGCGPCPLHGWAAAEPAALTPGGGTSPSGVSPSPPGGHLLSCNFEGHRIGPCDCLCHQLTNQTTVLPAARKERDGT